MNKFKKIFKNNLKIILMIIISIILLLIGSFEFGFVPTFIILLIIDTFILIVTKPKKKKNVSFKEVIKSLLIVSFCCAIILLLLGIGFCGYIVLTAGEFKQENLYNKDASIVYDTNGEVIAKLGTEIRKTVSYDKLSQSLVDAIIATEDSRYFQHTGVDLPRFIKASINQVLGKGGGGASTLTMQISKNNFTSTEDEGIEGIIRKFKDIYISVFQIERKYTKEDIIEFYVNSYYLGGRNTGVEQASLSYFNKSASELNVAEAAMIAGLFQAPVGYDPYIHPEACEGRRQVVLELMLRHGYINEDEYEIAKELSVDKLLVEHVQETTEYQDFVDTVVNEVWEREKIDAYSTPIQIYTTMDKDMQNHMNDIMSGETFKWKDDYVQAGIVIMDVKNGEIRAVGAGRNRVLRGNNYATDFRRQIGSTAKPLFDYGPGIEYNNWSTYTVFTDEPYAYSDGTKLKNWDNKYEGINTLHVALKRSRNIPAIKAFQQIDNSKIKDFVTNLGLSPDIQSNGKINEAHSIGGYTGESPLNVAAAYAAFSNGGYYIEPHSYTKIVLIETGETKDVKPITKRAMSEETAYMITKVLEDTSDYAIGLGVNGVNYAAKTGTTNLDSKTQKDYGLPSNAIMDKWVASFNDSYSIAVWYGYDNLSSEHYLTTNDYAVKSLFQAAAKSAYKKKSTWKEPDGVVELKVESGLPTAMLASEFTPENLKVTAYFKKGFEPTETSNRFSKLDNVTNVNFDETTSILSWDAISTPDFLNEEYLNKLYSPAFTDEETKTKVIKEVLDYNVKNIGEITYEIYSKDSTGNLTLLATTPETSYIYTGTTPITFVIKTTYTIFKDNISDGAEFTINTVSSVISSELNSESIIEIKVNDTYVEPTKPVIVLENGITDITDMCNITYSILRESDKQLFSNFLQFDTSKEETYTITYNINYKTYNNKITKVIKVIN